MSGPPVDHQPADAGRTVHPVLVQAAVRALRHDPAPGQAVTRAQDCLATGRPVPERLHEELLSALHARGWPAVLAAARHLLDRPRDPRIESLVASAGLGDLMARSRLVERWFHIGHTTDVTPEEHGIAVRHLRWLGGRPTVPDTLFVCAVYHVVCAAVTGRAPAVTLLGPGGGSLPLDTAWSRPAPPIAGFRLRWTDGVPGGAVVDPGLVGALRRWIALDPARPWRVGVAASALRVAPRTLQRELARAGTTFRDELLAVRLDLAGQLIRRTRLPLAEVAASTGFADHAHLTHRFRERFDRTPTLFRRQPEQLVAIVP